jgi:hypothetical protein
LPTIHLNFSKRLEILDGQFNHKRALATGPPIASGKALATAVNLNEPFPATVALHLSDSS